MKRILKTIRCFLGMHHYEVIETYPLLDPSGREVGKVLVSRCSDCGRLHSDRVFTVSTFSYDSKPNN